MKKLLLSMAMLGIIIPSCVKNDPEFTNNEVKIGFNSPILYSNTETKVNVFGEYSTFNYGTSTTYSYPKEENFMIFANHHLGDFVEWSDANKTEFSGSVISYDYAFDAWMPYKTTGTGESQQIDYYYWHDGYKLSYAAMSPADLLTDETTKDDLHISNPGTTVNYGVNGLVINNFKVPSDPAKHFDLLYSKLEKNKTAADMIHSASHYSGLPVYFKHALTQIRFSLMKDASVTDDIKLISITLSGIINKGNFQEINMDGSVDKGPKWTLSSDPSDFVDYQAYIRGNSNDPLLFPVQPKYVSDIIADGKLNNKDLGAAYPLLIIPQSLRIDPNQTEENSIKIEVEYKIGNASETSTKEVNLSKSLFTDINDAHFSISEWLPGQRYTFRLYYSTETQKKDLIYFSPSTEGWIEDRIVQIIL